MDNIDKDTLKHLDKFHVSLCKNFTEDEATGIVNDVYDVRLIPYICVNLKINAYEIVWKIYTCIKNIKQFRDIISEHLVNIVLAGIEHPGSMDVALKICEDINISSFSNKFTDEMLICIYKHGLRFPQNKEICTSFIQRFISPTIAINRTFFFINDEVDIVQKYFEKTTKAREYIYNFCTDCDSVKIFQKAIRYFKETNALLVKLSFPAFKENIHLFDLNDSMVRLKILDEVNTHNRWDFLPFIFDVLKPNDAEWEMFRIGLYRCYFNEVYFKVLLNYMEKYEIPIEKLKSATTKSLICSEEIMQVLQDFNLVETFNPIRAAKMNDYLKPDVCNLFYAFCKNNYKFITDYMHLSNSHFNSRFRRERNFVDNLVNNNMLGWDNSTVVIWRAFVSFTDDVIKELNNLEDILTKYNSFFSVSLLVKPLIAIRFVNDCVKSLCRLKNKFLIEECKKLIINLDTFKETIIEEVREIINVDTPKNQDWELPENPTLEDYFKYIYQYSGFGGSDKIEDGVALVKLLRSKNCYKIADEVLICFRNFVPIDDIERILRLKKII